MPEVKPKRTVPTAHAATPAPAAASSPTMGREVSMEEAEGGELPKLDQEPRFLLYWVPGYGCYQVRQTSKGESVLVPRISVLYGYPGIANVDGKNGISFARPVQEILDRGGVVLNGPTCRRHNLPSYIREHRIAGVDGRGNPRYTYAPSWMFPRRLRNGAWEMACDEDAKTAWEADLLARGIVPPPEDADLRAIMDRRVNRIERHASRSTEKERAAHDAEQADLERERAAIEAAGFALDGVAPPARPNAPREVPLPEDGAPNAP